MSIIIKNLNKSYKNTKILENLNLEIKSGSIFGLLGPNGAGKTTLVSILNSLIKKDSGEVFINDYNFLFTLFLNLTVFIRQLIKASTVSHNTNRTQYFRQGVI